MMKKNTAELLKELKNCERFESYYDDNENALLNVQLSEALREFAAAKGLKKSEIIRRSELNETYAHQIFSGKRHPERDKLICLVIGMELDIDETQELLKKSGYAQLYARDKRDSVLIYAVSHKFTLSETNEMLDKYGFQSI